nr:hypothetical protein [Tanacetum cinerariifolium]
IVDDYLSRKQFDKENYLEHPIPVAPVAPPGQQVPPQALVAHAAWVKGQKEVDVEEGQSVSSHVLKMKGYIDNLERLGQPVGKNLATMNELHAMLKLHEESLPKKDANPALHSIRAGRVQKNQKNNRTKLLRGVMKDNCAKDAICHQCGEVGHWKRKCYVYLAELMKKKKLSQGAIPSGLRGSKKLKPGALSLYVGDGHRATVEAIRTYHLELPSGLVIVLNNCHYATSITRDVISVSCLFDD